MALPRVLGPYREGRRTYRTEAAWQRTSPRFGREVRCLVRQVGVSRPLSEAEAFRLVRPVCPMFKTPGDLYRAAAWLPFKLIHYTRHPRRPVVQYLERGLRWWVRIGCPVFQPRTSEWHYLMEERATRL